VDRAFANLREILTTKMDLCMVGLQCAAAVIGEAHARDVAAGGDKVGDNKGAPLRRVQ
jgi:hypothetical protein